MTKEVRKILSILYKKYPSNKKTTLNRMRTNPEAFKILISCLLSLRARDENTEKVSKQLFAVASSPETIATLPTKKLQELISFPIIYFLSGFYSKKKIIIYFGKFICLI